MDPAAILVLGARVLPGGRPSGALCRRLAVAATTARRFPDALVVVCGGRGWSGAVEADVMARELGSQGVSAGRILRERMSLSTVENFVRARLLLRRRFGELPEVAVVTCDWHMGRSLHIARRLGFRVLPMPARSEAAPIALRLGRAVRETAQCLIDVALATRASRR